MIESGQRWRHLKRGGIYEVLCTTARVQISTVTSQELANLEKMQFIAYQAVGGTDIYFRLKSEFLDGRFVRVT